MKMNSKNILILDTENTTFQKGNPFSTRNKCCAVGYYDGKGSPVILKIEYDDEPYGTALRTLQTQLDNSDLLVGFNLKYDLHWLRRYGLKFANKRLWDCQLAHFLITGHTQPYPALDDVAERYGLAKKLDVVKEEYWNKGIDTDGVPWDTLYEYLKQDLVLTHSGFIHQLKELESNPKLLQCIKIACMDTAVLAEMEWNGIPLDVEQSLEKSRECENRLAQIDAQLAAIVNVDNINWNSVDQVSVVLYGGSIPYTVKEPYEFVYKDGKKATKFRNVVRQHTFPRLVTPLPDTALKKPGYFQTGSDVLSRLRATGNAKHLIKRLIERHDLEKLNGTYYAGLPKLIKEMDWPDNTLHGQLNQCVAVTGRLSSTKPNMQNQPPEVDILFRSRYD